MFCQLECLPCGCNAWLSLSRYLINFLLDASLGMLFIYAGVRAVSAIVEWRQWDRLRFGEYGETSHTLTQTYTLLHTYTKMGWGSRQQFFVMTMTWY